MNFHFPLSIKKHRGIVWTYSIDGGVGNGFTNPDFPNNQYVCIFPFPFISVGPRYSSWYPPARSNLSLVVWDKWIRQAAPKNVSPIFFHVYLNVYLPVDSILDAVFTVSPKRQYLGIVKPTTPEQQGPVWSPIRNRNGVPGKWRIRNLPLWCNKSNAIVAICKCEQFK